MTERCPGCGDEDAPRKLQHPGTILCRRCGCEWDPSSGEILTEPHDPDVELPEGDVDADVFSVGFSSREYEQLSSTSAAARAFTHRLEKIVATLDTSTYRAVEVITVPHVVGGVTVSTQPTIRLVEEGDPLADELIELGVIPDHVSVERYSAEQIDEMKSYAQAALDRDELEPLERFVERRLDVPDDQVTQVAKRIARSIRQHADPEDFADVDGGDA